jgi:hypothetical protein
LRPITFFSLNFCLCCCLGIAGCTANMQVGQKAGSISKPQKSLAGMTVNVLGEHITKHHGMSDVSLVAVMGENAFEIFGNPDDKKAPRLVVSWTADQEGVPIVARFIFTGASLPDLEDQDLVIDFCQKLLYGKDAK